MKCTVERSKLLEHLQKVCNVVDRKTAMPILNNLYVEAKDDTLTLTATNLEIRITTTLRAEVEIEGVTTIPSKSLLALVSCSKTGISPHNTTMEIIYNPIGVFTNAKSKKTEKYCLFEAEFVP